MCHRSILWAAIALLASSLLGAGPALATVKCQCNDGSVTLAMGYDYSDDDLDDACDDACGLQGGGRVWNLDTDQDSGDDVAIGRGERPREEPRPRER